MKYLLFILTMCFSFNSKAQDVVFGKISTKELKEKLYPLDSTADAAYLYKSKDVSYEFTGSEGWYLITKVHERIKIYNKKGFDYANKTIKLFNRGGKDEKVTNLKAYTFFIDEKGEVSKLKLSKKEVFEEEKTDYWSIKKITMPGIKEGVIIDLTYQKKSPYYQYIDKITIQENIPVKKISIKVNIPEYFTFKSYQKGYYPISLQKSNKNRIINYSYRQKNCTTCATTSRYNEKVNLLESSIEINEENLPSLKDTEPYCGNINNYRAGLEFELSSIKFPNTKYSNYTGSWNSVCKTIYKSSNFGSELEKSSYYKKDLQNILSYAKNDYEKTALIFQFVKTKIKWNTYYAKYTDKGVKKAYKEGVGNAAEINLILTSMLRNAGLDTNPVLVSTRNNGIPLFPTLDGFNYVISKVNFSDGKYILLDATEIYTTPNTLPIRALNWYGREVLKNGESKQVKLTPSSLTKETNSLFVKIDELGGVTGIFRKSLTGHSAMFYRQKNNVKKEEDIITSTEEKLGIEIETFKVLNTKKINKPIMQTIKFTGEDFIEEINNKLYFNPAFFLATKENPFKSEERKFPIDFGMPWQNNFSVSISIPDGYIIESYPKELAISLPENIGVFKYKILTKDNKISLLSVTQFNSSIISPSYYPTIKEFYTQLVQKQTEKIVLIKK
ncbi:Transglutaminase-like superfamily protein [Tenacibaculum sediminilitoris]|uniref:transglutaminase domain-containing protein n=1 Tax=Tenacibaculum sediminilitoris TaxID=1820334 RepID=UPI003893CBD5